ncbi:MAG: flagellar hook capping FlgD N-terminal domain-containing protein [Angelakisella sp.]
MANPINPAAQAPHSPKKPNKVNAIYEDESKKGVTVDNFLNLMIAQMQNQDPMNPMEDTQYVTQLAQFATMQQMQQLAYYSQSNFTMSLVGKDVTVARNTISGGVETFTGPVEKVSLTNNEYLVYVDGKTFALNQIMEIHPPASNAGSGEAGVVEDYGLSLTETTSSSAKLVWDVPTKEQDPDTDRLRYSVYYSTDDKFDTVAEVKKYGKLVGKADQTGVHEVTIDELAAGGTYYVNVIVKDIHGKESVYKKQVVLTPTKPKEEAV